MPACRQAGRLEASHRVGIEIVLDHSEALALTFVGLVERISRLAHGTTGWTRSRLESKARLTLGIEAVSGPVP
jgi:hypothetical protein